MKSSQADHFDERELAVRRLNFSLTSPIFSHFCDCVGLIRLSLLRFVRSSL